MESPVPILWKKVSSPKSFGFLFQSLSPMHQGLKNLVKTAESKNENGEEKIFTITDRTANAAGIRQVRFVESLNWDEAETMQMWEVSFALQEYMSNPERIDNRKDFTSDTKRVSGT